MMTNDLSPAEWRIMNVVWKSQGKTTVRETLDVLQEDTGWAYTTLKTMMDRLVEKGALAVDRSRKPAGYRAAIARHRARHDAAKSLVNRAFEGAVAPLVHELIRAEELTDRERAELERMVKRLEESENS